MPASIIRYLKKVVQNFTKHFTSENHKLFSCLLDHSNWIIVKSILQHKIKTPFLWEVSSGSESKELLAWQAENSTSRWGSLWDRSPVGSQFPKSLFRDVHGIVPESVRTCGFERNSSDLDRAPKMQNSLLQNSWDSFLVSLPSIFSETCVIYSSVIPGTDVFRDWLFLGCSCVSHETAANFRLFLNDAISCRKKYSTVVKTEFSVFFIQLEEWQKFVFQKKTSYSLWK